MNKGQSAGLIICRSMLLALKARLTWGSKNASPKLEDRINSFDRAFVLK